MSQDDANPPILLKKRFIAGVVCPKCNGMDTTQVHYFENAEDERHCVQCGYTDSQKSNTTPEIIETRVNYQEADKTLRDEDVQVLKFHFPKNEN